MIVRASTRVFAPALAAALLAACTVGPDYVRPTPVEPAAFARAETGTQGSTMPAPADDAFWERFADPLLTELVEEALAANYDLRIALSRYDRANALLRESFAVDRVAFFFPPSSGGGFAAELRVCYARFTLAKLTARNAVRLAAVLD